MRSRLLRNILSAGMAGWSFLSVCLSSQSEDSAPPIVLTSVAPIADLVKRVAGGDAKVVQLIPDGQDAHTFEPPPSGAKAFTQAGLVIFNGLDLEESLLKMVKASVPARTPVVLLAESTVQPKERIVDRREQGNPHVWMNPIFAGRYAEAIRDELSRVDPGHASGYKQRAQKLLRQLDALDKASAAAVRSIPAGHRKLVTYHDSWSYFTRQYGMTLIAAIQPASFLEPSAQEVAAIVQQVKQTGVPAIFGSEVFSSPVLETIGRETGVRYVDTLRDDVLPGAPGDPEHSYVGMMVENVKTLVSALGGDPKLLDEVSLSD